MSLIPLTEDQARFLGVSTPKASHESFPGALTTTARTSPPTPNLTRENAIPTYTRQKLVERFHALRNSAGILRKMVARTVKGAVGGGISPKATSEDAEWNKAHDEYFEVFAMSPGLIDYEERRTFYEMQASVAAELIGPGESFTNVVDVDGESLPRFQLIPCQFIRDAGTKLKNIDGLVLDPKSSAVRKYIYSPEYGKATPLDAEDVLHVYDWERAGQYRGLPWIYHGVNSLIDIGDLTQLEKSAAKIHSAMAAVVKGGNGTVGGGLGGIVETATKQAQNEDGTTTDYKVALQKMLGAQVPFLPADKELQLLTSTRPSAVFTGFLTWLAQDIAAGFGIPVEYVTTIDALGGVNTRFVVDEAQLFFDSVGTMVIDRWSRHVRNRVISAAMQSGRLLQCKDPNWPIKCDWRRPARGTVDRGKEAQSNISLMQQGMLTFGEYHGGFGKDGYEMAEERIKEVAWQKMKVAEIAKESGIQLDWSEIFDRGGGSPPANATKEETPPATKTKPAK